MVYIIGPSLLYKEERFFYLQLLAKYIRCSLVCETLPTLGPFPACPEKKKQKNPNNKYKNNHIHGIYMSFNSWQYF